MNKKWWESGGKSGGKFQKRHLPSEAESVQNVDTKAMRPEGIEPPSQEPESYVISTTLRTRTRLLV